MFPSIVLIVIVTFLGKQVQCNDQIILGSLDLWSPFEEIISAGIYNVYLHQIPEEDTPRIEITGKDNTTYHIRVSLTLLQARTLNIFGVALDSSKISVHIYFNTNLQRFAHVGAGDIFTVDDGIVNTGMDQFILDHVGTGDVTMKLAVAKFEANLFGSGDYEFTGTVANEAVFNVKNLALVDAFRLKTKIAKVFVEGSSKVEVSATNDMEIEVSGSSQVSFRLPDGKTPSNGIKRGNGQIFRRL